MGIRFQLLTASSFGIRLESSAADVEIRIRPLREGEAVRPTSNAGRLARDAKGSQVLSGIVVDRLGKPAPGIRVGVRQRLNFNILSAYATTKADGTFELKSLPDEPLELYYHNPKVRGYPAGKGAVSIPYTGYYVPALNQQDIRMLYDSELARHPAELDLNGK